MPNLGTGEQGKVQIDEDLELAKKLEREERDRQQQLTKKRKEQEDTESLKVILQMEQEE